MTYNERVRSIAEEMAMKSNPGVYSKREDERFVHIWANTISSFLPAARIAVKHMAEISDDAITWADLNNDLIPSENFKIEQGLIPDIVEPVKQPEREDWKL